MKKVKIITDSQSGFSQEEANKLGITNVAMPFLINGKDYLEGVNISIPEFFELLKDENAEISTSQPSLGYMMEVWDELLKDNDEIVYIPMMSGLSGTCENAARLAGDEKYAGKVFVVDNLRISVTQKESVLEALALASEGKTGAEIKAYLEETKSNALIFIMVSTLKYLKKGGRVTPAVAALGSMLKLKPILATRGGNFEKSTIVFSENQGKKKMIQMIKKEIESKYQTEYEEGKISINFAHTQNEAEALAFREETMKDLPKAKYRFVDDLSLSVSCHIGAGAVGISFSVNNYMDKTPDFLLEKAK